MEIQTIQKYIHTSPRKLRLVADMIRKMQPNKALDLLRVTQKYAAKDLVKALETVLANAKQSGLDSEKIGFKKIEIDASIVMKRFHAGTRGRVRPYKRRMSHIKIVLSDDVASSQIVESKKEISETKDRSGQSSNETKSTKGGRTGLSK